MIHYSAVHAVESVSSQFNHAYNDIVDEVVSETNYVGMLLDSLQMGKHVGVHRNFDDLPFLLKQASTSKEKWYIDVWPVKDHTSDTYDSIDRPCFSLLCSAQSAKHILPATLHLLSYLLRLLTVTTTAGALPHRYTYSYELLLQLAAILHMTKRWRKLTVRVIELVDLEQQEEAERQRVKSFLEDIRITNAEIKVEPHVISTRCASAVCV